MSTTPDARRRPDDRLVTVISRWLARHVPDEELRRELDVSSAELQPDQAEAIEELRAELDSGAGRADLEMVARETLEALALGS
jgi:hypothetical protein